MKHTLTVLFLITFCLFVKAQTRTEDSLLLAQTIEWLENKLTYHYYNADDDEWWINRFTFNRGSKTVTIKNINSPQLQTITDKTYLQLNFKLEDLNPYTIAIEKTEKNAGRLVAGKTIRVGAYHYDKTITRTRNGRMATHQSFIYFAIPKYLEDSVSNYTQEVADKLTAAILLATKIYPDANGRSNVQTLKGLVNDRFKSGDTYWEIGQLFEDTYEVAVRDTKLKLLEKRFIRFDPLGQEMELTILKNNSPTTALRLSVLKTDGFSFRNEEISISFKNRNEFTLIENGEVFSFVRDWTWEAPEARQ